MPYPHVEDAPIILLHQARTVVRSGVRSPIPYSGLVRPTTSALLMVFHLSGKLFCVDWLRDVVIHAKLESMILSLRSSFWVRR